MKMLIRSSSLALALAAAALLSGCTGDDSSSSVNPRPRADWNSPQAPIPVQMVRTVPALKDQRFSTLMDFESDADSIFLSAGKTGGTQVTFERAHTGHRSLRLEPDLRRIAIKLAPLMGARPFPGDWTLAGAFFYCEKPIEIVVSVDNVAGIEPRTIRLTPGSWSMVLADITTATATIAAAHPTAAPMLSFELPPKSPPVWMDDALLIDNSKTIVERSTAQTAEPSTKISSTTSATTISTATTTVASTVPTKSAASWSIEKRGLNFVGNAPGKFNFKLITSEAVANGWTLDEANELRARFHSTGSVKNLTIYSDGRAMWDGKFKSMTQEIANTPAYVAQHDSPAEITVVEELGRLERDSAGDANNDGYNEQRGAYKLITTGSRIEFKVIPHTATLLRPAFELKGLPGGRVLITSEGRLVETSTRLDDGTLLFELPGKIDRPMTVNVRLQ